MKPLSKRLGTAAIAFCAMTASVHAQTWNTDHTPFELVAQDPTFAGATCDTGTMVGTTGMDSDTIDVDVEFQEPCSLSASGLTATVDCADGEFTRLRALTADTNQGEVDELLTGFECTAIVAGVCTIRVGPQDLPLSGGANSADLIDEGGPNAALDVSVDLWASNNNSLCGPVPSMTTGWDGLYHGAVGLTIDP